MHDTALDFGKRFFEAYTKKNAGLKIVEIGAQDVNGSLRLVALEGNEYIGVDFVEGRGVDVVTTDPYKLPFDDNSVDICVSSSCLEHSEFFWVLFLECIRILKPTGILYIDVPSNGSFHRYPVDCWRFYPDSGIALQHWANRNGFDTILLESFVGNQNLDQWNDFVAVFLKDGSQLEKHPLRILSTASNYTNGRVHGSEELRNFASAQEDQRTRSWIVRLTKIARRALRHLVG